LIHAVTSPRDVDSRLKNGVLYDVLKAKESRKVKHIGFSGHSDYNAHQRMLKSTDESEACQMPINTFDPNYKHFITNLMPPLVEKVIASYAMKPLANSVFFGGTTHFNGGAKPRIVPNTLNVEEVIHFSWSTAISVLVTGADHADMLTEKIELAKIFKAFDEKNDKN